MIASLWETGCKVRISEDGYTATLELSDPKGKFRYEALAVIRYVKVNGVIFGIKEERIFQMAVEEIYDKEVVIAEGIRAMAGHDGSYEYYFRTNIECKPTIMKDGTVNYLEKDLFELVTTGQLLARYIRATKGSNGRNVKNEKIIAKKGEELSPLRGRGFVLSTNHILYHASISGQVSVENDTILSVNNVCIHDGNLTPKEGNIHFDGNVIIHGAVYPGLVVEATGEVVVDGIVDSATIRSGGIMLLREGVVGKGSCIEANHSVKGKFFEAAKIKVDGDLECNYILNCNAYASGNIYVIGKKSIILGGTTCAGLNIITSNAGSEAETKTYIQVRISNDYYSKVDELNEQREVYKKELIELEEVTKLNPQKTKASYSRVREIVNAQKKCEEEIIKLNEYYERAQSVRIEVTRYIFPGVTVCVNMNKLTLKQSGHRLLFKKKDGHLAVYKA